MPNATNLPADALLVVAAWQAAQAAAAVAPEEDDATFDAYTEACANLKRTLGVPVAEKFMALYHAAL